MFLLLTMPCTILQLVHRKLMCLPCFLIPYDCSAEQQLKNRTVLIKKETVLSISTLKLLSWQFKQACAKTSWTLMCHLKHLIMNLWCCNAVFLIVYVICANGDCQLHQYFFLCEASVFVLFCFIFCFRFYSLWFSIVFCGFRSCYATVNYLSSSVSVSKSQ